MYAEPPQSFDEMLKPFPPEVRKIAEWLRDLLLSEFPQLDENIYGGAKIANALYSIGGTERVAVGIQPGLRYVKLFLHDPDHLPESVFKLEGKGKHMRHIKLDAIPESARADIVRVVTAPISRRM